jgi:polyisoprenyl-teichoic acid--peptidoglycan teichoic acid transferase
MKTKPMLLGLVALLLVAAGWQGWKWQRALGDVGAMLVPTVALPSAVPTQRPAIAITAGRATVAPARPTAAPATPTAMPKLDAALTILLLGTDTRPSDVASRTDALAVVHIDPHTQRVGLLSLPRDLWVPIPGQGEARINAAYPLGELHIGKGYGPALAKQTVGDLLGIPIERFVLLDLNGFKTLIDALGGIELDVSQALDDPAYPTDDYGTIAIHFDAGPQRMDGARALMYARTRHADSDFGRNRRQQQVLMAIFAQIQAQGLLRNLANLDVYTGALRDSLRTDLSREELIQLAGLGASLRGEQIERYALDQHGIVILDAPATFAADPQALQALVGALLGDVTGDKRQEPGDRSQEPGDVKSSHILLISSL